MSSNTTHRSRYREKILFLTDRTFELFDDRVFVRANVRGVRSEANVLISALTLPSYRIWLRSKHVDWSFSIVCILSSLFMTTILLLPTAWWLLIPEVILLLPGLYYYIRSRKQNEYVRFANSQGIVILDIGRVGPDVDLFDDFVSDLTAMIEIDLPKRVVAK